MKQMCFVVVIFMLAIMNAREGEMPMRPERELLPGGILVERHGIVRSLGLVEEDLIALVYGEDEIPGFECKPGPYTAHHTVICLDVGGERQGVGLKGIYSSIRRMWNLHIRNKPRLDIECKIFADEKGARRELQAMLSPITSSGFINFREGSYSGLPLGDICWRNPIGNSIFFTIGRVYVLVQVFGPSEANGFFAEALSWGIEYCILQHPKKLGMAKKPMTVLAGNQPVAQGKAVTLAGVTVAPISSLSSAKVSLKTERDKKEWAVTASLNGRRVKVKAFSWEMETEKGKVKLERPVFPYGGELIVPLRQVAEALGIRVQQKGETIALLP
ncbi:MAG: hypothetical protein IMHGJWDQ_001658 [Candidatus Fervidibacter sp.]